MVRRTKRRCAACAREQARRLPTETTVRRLSHAAQPENRGNNSFLNSQTIPTQAIGSGGEAPYVNEVEATEQAALGRFSFIGRRPFFSSFSLHLRIFAEIDEVTQCQRQVISSQHADRSRTLKRYLSVLVLSVNKAGKALMPFCAADKQNLPERKSIPRRAQNSRFRENELIIRLTPSRKKRIARLPEESVRFRHPQVIADRICHLLSMPANSGRTPKWAQAQSQHEQRSRKSKS